MPEPTTSLMIDPAGSGTQGGECLTPADRHELTHRQPPAHPCSLQAMLALTPEQLEHVNNPT